MERTNYMKLVWITAFAVFAGISCWATAESLHLLLNTWPIVIVYAVTFGFFLIASLGTKLIVDSLNKSIYVEKRGAKLLGGLALCIVFWLVFSMPTNTHTFFYRTVISDMVNNDLSLTKNYLGQIKGNTKNINQAKNKVGELKNKVDGLLGSLCGEIMNEANPGFGPKAKSLLRQFADLFGEAKIEPLSYRGTSQQEREKICDAYREMMYRKYKDKANNIITNIINPASNLVKDVDRDIENLNRVANYIKDGTTDLNDADGIKDVCNQLNTGYNTIKVGKDFVNFNSQEDEMLYTASNPVTKVARMLSVWHVWGDYLRGNFSGYGFIYWIIISILVDIAAFIFFDLAFRKQDY